MDTGLSLGVVSIGTPNKRRMSSIYCSICQKETSHVVFFEGGRDWEYGVPGEYRQEQCESCGLVTMVPMPSPAEVLTFYPSTYHGYQSATSALTRWLIERNLRQRADGYRKLIGTTGTILDVGAADGAHFDVWKTEGSWEFVGFEFNDEIAADARAHGRNVATATMETFDAQGKQFDLIIMNHLLEHVPDPLDTARRAFALLKPGGWLVGEVPNLRSLDRWIAGRYWGGCHWPRHLQQFTPSTMRRMLTTVGFESPRLSFLLHTSHWALSVQNWLQSTSWGKTTLQNGRAWYYPILLLAFVPLNLIQKIFGCTGIMGFSARKPL
jgi:SAM-dependent methyltransferase